MSKQKWFAINKVLILRKCLFLLFVISVGPITAQQGARYLIVTHDNFYNIVKPLAEWKNRTGMECRVARLSEIGSTADAIRNYIVNAYNNWPLRPEYLLLVGAPNLLPFPQVDGVYSDNYYTNMDGDIYNEILSGRLTVHDSIEAHTVINKILAYERYPLTADPDWFRKGTLIVNQNFSPEDSIYWSDARYAVVRMSENGFIGIDTFSNIYNDDAADVINAVNDGRSFLMYRGAATNNWYPPFDCDPDITQNGAKLPIVLSVTCGTLGTGPTPAYAERWFLTGTPSIPRGGSGYFATSTQYHAGSRFRSAVAKGFFDAAFRDRKRTFGEACEEGRIQAQIQYPDSGLYEYYGFTTVGDPEMGLWTDTPCSLKVTHPAFLPFGSADFEVYVVRTASGSAVAGAFVCVSGKRDTMVYALDTTDAAGYAYFNLHPQVIKDTMFVTVTGRNLRPYEGRMTVMVMSAPHIVYSRSLVDDSVSGNCDGVINPGEAINLPVWVKNWGDSAGYGVTGLLRTVDPFVTVTDSVRSFGNVPGRDSAFTGADGFEFSVVGNCPDTHGVEFELACVDQNDSTWTSRFLLSVRSADLIFLDALVSGGNGNGSFEAGETVGIMVRLKNIGSAGIDSVRATIRSVSPFSGILDSTGYYNHIGHDSAAINTLDSFIIFNDSLTPIGMIIDYILTLRTGYYSDTVHFTLTVGKKAYYIWNPDPTPASGVNIDSTLQSLGYAGELGSNLPVNLGKYRTLFICTGVYPNKYVIRDTSLAARSIRDFLVIDSGRVYLEGGDVWWYDPAYNNGYHFDSLFGLNATADGNSDMGPVTGIAGAFTAGMNFNYGGENNWMDHISPTTGVLIFRDADNNYDCGVAHDAGAYRTVGVSFELGLLVDAAPPSTRQTLLDSIMHFFGISNEQEIVEQRKFYGPLRFRINLFPTPFQNRTRIDLALTAPASTKITAYDIAGREMAVLLPKKSLSAGIHTYFWDGFDKNRTRITCGVYFIRFEIGDIQKSIKVIFIE